MLFPFHFKTPFDMIHVFIQLMFSRKVGVTNPATVMLNGFKLSFVRYSHEQAQVDLVDRCRIARGKNAAGVMEWRIPSIVESW